MVLPALRWHELAEARRGAPILDIGEERGDGRGNEWRLALRLCWCCLLAGERAPRPVQRPRLAAGSASSIEENGGLVLSSEEASITLAAVGVDAPDSEGRNVAGNPFSMAIEVTPHNALIALSSCSTFTSGLVPSSFAHTPTRRFLGSGSAAASSLCLSRSNSSQRRILKLRENFLLRACTWQGRRSSMRFSFLRCVIVLWVMAA